MKLLAPSRRASAQLWIAVSIGLIAAANFAPAEAQSRSEGPNLERDTLSPVYDWKALPFRWETIRAGEFPLTPVHWRRSAANPILPEGMNCRPVRWDDRTLRVFYSIRGPGHGIHSFDVDPAAPEKIKARSTKPILTTGASGSYDDDWVLAPEPVRLSPTHLRMYYSAKKQGAFFQNVWSLAAAESHDNGQTWNKYAGNPILTATDDTWECGAVGFCSVEKIADTWRMWYLGTNDQQDACKQVGFATSSDGLNWKRYDINPILAVNPKLRWEAGAIAVPRVIRDGPLYKVWYCCYEHNNTYAIGQAESIDGLRWFRSPHNPVMQGLGGKGFDSQMTAYPGTIKVGDEYLMWYSGNRYGSDGVGLATARTPRGTWLYRVGATETPDESWTAWQAIPEQEPPREGFVQFAVIEPKEER